LESICVKRKGCGLKSRATIPCEHCGSFSVRKLKAIPVGINLKATFRCNTCRKSFKALPHKEKVKVGVSFSCLKCKAVSECTKANWEIGMPKCSRCGSFDVMAE